MLRWIMALVVGFVFPVMADELSIIDSQGERHLVKTHLLAQQFPAAPVVTANPWAPEVHQYTGINIESLLDHYGLADTRVRLIDLDNYSVVLEPGELATLRQPILATQKDGRPLTRRDFGPTWLIVDFDQHPDLDVERTRNLSVWQLAEIAPEQ